MYADKLVMFLTNNENSIPLVNWIKERCKVILISQPITIVDIKNYNPDIVISYNYEYIVGTDVIDAMNSNIINMHISYLPWNRGFSPNLWSFLEDTPKGVTIHKLSSGLDKGDIMYQKRFEFDINKDTLESSYNFLNNAITELFKLHFDEIMSGDYQTRRQIDKGSYHSKKDLEELKSHISFEWEDSISSVVVKYKELLGE